MNGIVYVDRRNQNSRKESLKIMKWLLEQGVSVLIYPAGGWNNTENLLEQHIFSGAYKLSVETGIEVVPLSNFLVPETNTIHVSFGKPLHLINIAKKKQMKK